MKSFPAGSRKVGDWPARKSLRISLVRCRKCVAHDGRPKSKQYGSVRNPMRIVLGTRFQPTALPNRNIPPVSVREIRSIHGLCETPFRDINRRRRNAINARISILKTVRIPSPSGSFGNRKSPAKNKPTRTVCAPPFKTFPTIVTGNSQCSLARIIPNNDEIR